MLSISHLRKAYVSVVAVDDISFDVGDGEIFGLIGPNGAGKTTTIRMITNIIAPEGGTILYNGKPFSPEVTNMIGFLPEERGLYRKSTVLNTILYLAELRGINRTEGKRRATAWLKRFDLSANAERKVEELSKGNQQKVQFITSILHNPSLLILDEPFSGLDPVNQLLMKDIMMELRKQGKAIIFSTHMMEQAEKLCERICLINKGNVVLSGGLEEIKSRFGKRTVRIEFNGDAAFLKQEPSVRNVILYENIAEVDLAPDSSVEDLLRAAMEHLTLTSFSLQQPSLEAIFLEAVGGIPAREGVAR